MSNWLRKVLGFFRSIRFRLTLWTVVILGIVLLLFCLFVYSRQLQDLRSIDLDQLALRSHQVSVQLGLMRDDTSPDPGSMGPPGTVSLQNNEVLALVDSQGQILQQSGPVSEADVSRVVTNIRQLNLPAGPFSYSQEITPASTTSPREDYIFLVSPIAIRRQVVGLLVLGQPLDAGNQLPRLIATLVLASLGTLLLALAGGYWLAGRAMQPVQVITRAARQISETDLSHRLNLNTGDELGELADTFDSMLARLQNAFDRQRQFTADASHELRTPLTIVNLETSRALETRRPVHEYERAMQIIHSENEYMTRLVTNLLTLARMDAGQTVMKQESLDLSDVALEVVERLVQLACNQGVELETGELPEVSIQGDRSFLVQMLSNLVENAIKYHGSAEPRVRVETGQEDQLAWIKVIDNGPGIPSEDLPHIFERFYRVDKARSRLGQEEITGGEDNNEPSGSGLGLSIVQGIVKAHGGAITVQSEAGKGTQFEIQLPI